MKVLKVFYLIFILWNIVVPLSAVELVVVTYNVKNLYPGVHQIKKIVGKDVDLEDFEYTPLDNKEERKKYCDKKLEMLLKKPEMQGEEKKGLIKYLYNFCLKNKWTPDRAEQKIKVLAEIIKSHNVSRPRKRDGQIVGELTAPDLLAVTEITTPAMAQKLALALGYNEKDSLITDSDNIRGINQALIFNSNKLELVQSHDYKIASLDGEELRNVLYARFMVKESLDIKQNKHKYLNIFVVHFPAPYHTDEQKKYYFNQFMDIVDKQSIESGEPILLTGDFNTSSADDYENKFNLALENKGFFDVRSHLTNSNFWNSRNDKVQGSHYFQFKKSWSFLDHFYLSLNKQPGTLEKIVSQFDVIVTYSNSLWDHVNSVRRPNSKKCSDHYPIRCTLNL